MAQTSGRAQGGFWSSPCVSQSRAVLKGLSQFSELRVRETQRHNKSRERREKNISEAKKITNEEIITNEKIEPKSCDAREQGVKNAEGRGNRKK